MLRVLCFGLVVATFGTIAPAVENSYLASLLTIVAIVMLALCWASLRGLWNVLSDLLIFLRRDQSVGDSGPPSTLGRIRGGAQRLVSKIGPPDS